MAVKNLKIGLTFRHPRVTRGFQESALRAAGATVIHNVGVDCPSALHAAKDMEPGDVILVYACTMVPPPRKKSGLPLHTVWTEFIATVHLRGYVLEVSTGRRSNVRAEFKAMNAETHELLRQGGRRLPKSNAPRGGQRKQWPSTPKQSADEIREAALRLWNSKSIKHDTAAIRVIMDQFSHLVDTKGEPLITERMIRALGKSWRNR